MSDTMEGARRWRGMVCPDCRFVFRVPMDHQGLGVACPSCRRLLRITGPAEEPPPLLTGAEGQAVAGSHGNGEIRRRKKKKKKAVLDTPWEKEPGQQAGGRQRAVHMGWQLAAGVVLLSVLVIWLAKLMDREPPDGPTEVVPVVSDVSVPEVVAGEAPEAVPKPWYQMDAVEELSRKFLAASGVEEFLPLIRDSERLQLEVRKWYPDGKKERMELDTLKIVKQRSAGKWRVLTLLAETKSYEKQFINVCETADGLKVDWESWVGYSSMPWQEIVEKKPTEPVLVRAVLSHVDYYNMDFADDRKWSSFRIASPDGEHVLYAYAGSGTDLKERVFGMYSVDSPPDIRVVLMIRYPEAARSSNQVILERVVAEGWLISETEP